MWGAAILAGNAIGLYPDIEKTAIGNIKITKEYFADRNTHEKYKPYISIYSKFVKQPHPYYKQLQNIELKN